MSVLSIPATSDFPVKYGKRDAKIIETCHEATGTFKNKTIDTSCTIDSPVVLTDGTVAAAKMISVPSHVVKFAGTFQTAGGDANETITVSGALATDIVLVSLKAKGASPVTIVAAAAAVDAISVTMSGDPSTDHYIYYMVLRAAS